MEKDIKNLGEKLDLVIDLMKQGFDNVDKRFETVDQRFDAVDQRFRGIDDTLKIMNTKIDWIHDDNKELKRHQEKIEEELVKPIQRKTSIRYVAFSGAWGIVSFLIAIFASGLTFGIAKAMGI